MTESNPDLKKEAWSWLKPVQMIHLATLDGSLPRVRPVSLIFDEGKFWTCTGTNDSKVRQLEQNPGFEFSLMLEKDDSRGTLRCSGNALIVTDSDVRSMMASKIPFFDSYWETPEDPTFCLIELHVEDVEFMRPGDMTSTRFKVVPFTL